MTKRKFFMRMISLSLIRRISRMIVALLAIAVGATILSGLVTIYIDVPRQMGAEFRNYGANMIFITSEAETPMTMETVQKAVGMIDKDQLVGMAPYRYESIMIREIPFEAAATDLDGAKLTSPYWYIDGEWPEKSGQMILGKEIAQTLDLSTGDFIDIVYSTEDDEVDENGVTEAPTMNMEITGILETGGTEEEYFYLSLEDLAELTGTEGNLNVVELSVSATAEELNAYTEKIGAAVPEISPRLVKRVAESESQVLTKLQALVFLVSAVVLVLIMICVATTMNAVVTERRKEIGLRKALGASDGSIIKEFMGEGLLLGAFGGLIGAFLGFLFAQYVSVSVFSSTIRFQFWLVPVTLIVSILVTGIACIFPVRSATDVDPALVLKGE